MGAGVGSWRQAARAALAACGLASPAAAEGWTVTPLADAAAYEALATESGDRAPDGLPDGFVAEAPADVADIRRAWYAAPTTRYAHGVIGDAIEAGALVVETAGGAVLRVQSPATEVFEDRTPRIVDLDGDGRAEIVTIRASTSGGGSVAVFGVQDGALALRAATPFIGRPNRWLNIAALADLAGLGRRQIAYVETPHIGGILHLYDYADGSLRRLASANGFSNHAIGARELRLSAVIAAAPGGGPALAVPNARRARLRVVAYEGGAWRDRASIPLPARVEGPLIAAPATQGRPRLWTRLSDGVVYEIAPGP